MKQSFILFNKNLKSNISFRLNICLCLRMKFLFILACLFLSLIVFSQTSDSIKVHFLYGSKPKRAFKKTESKWFGGKSGGHVGIEGDNGKILNFLLKGKFHWFANSRNKHSTYDIHSYQSFYSVLGGDGVSSKKTIITIPVTNEQKELFNNISNNYLSNTPYDYAFVGMRCGAAAHDILGQLGIVKAYSYRKTYLKIFYPKKLRKKLLKTAKEKNWPVYQEEGTNNRKWERD